MEQRDPRANKNQKNRFVRQFVPAIHAFLPCPGGGARGCLVRGIHWLRFHLTISRRFYSILFSQAGFQHTAARTKNIAPEPQDHEYSPSPWLRLKQTVRLRTATSPVHPSLAHSADLSCWRPSVPSRDSASARMNIIPECPTPIFIWKWHGSSRVMPRGSPRSGWPGNLTITIVRCILFSLDGWANALSAETFGSPSALLTFWPQPPSPGCFGGRCDVIVRRGNWPGCRRFCFSRVSPNSIGAITSSPTPWAWRWH